MWLEERYDFEVIEEQKANCKNGIKSLLIESSDQKFHELEGTILWKAQSPFRPKHKRKNWYFSLRCYGSNSIHKIDQRKVVYQSMKSPKKGGQHVNTTCSGVLAIYKPLGLEALSFDERSQHRNKKIALFRLMEKIEKFHSENMSREERQRWHEGKSFERGNEVLVFEG